jgi:nucleoside-diphosphate-sugar epimerase
MLRGDLADAETLEASFDRGPDRVVHLAGQPGARHSFEDPRSYVEWYLSYFGSEGARLTRSRTTP